MDKKGQNRGKSEGDVLAMAKGLHKIHKKYIAVFISMTGVMAMPSSGLQL